MFLVAPPRHSREIRDHATLLSDPNYAKLVKETNGGVRKVYRKAWCGPKCERIVKWLLDVAYTTEVEDVWDWWFDELQLVGCATFLKHDDEIFERMITALEEREREHEREWERRSTALEERTRERLREWERKRERDEEGAVANKRICTDDSAVEATLPTVEDIQRDAAALSPILELAPDASDEFSYESIKEDPEYIRILESLDNLEAELGLDGEPCASNEISSNFTAAM